MATYSELFESFDSVFWSNEWKDVDIPAMPANFTPDTLPSEFVKFEIITTEAKVPEYGDENYRSGIFICQVYTQANQGPNRLNEVVDLLDSIFKKKLLEGGTQTSKSAIDIKGKDSNDPSLFRADYSLTFNSY